LAINIETSETSFKVYYGKVILLSVY